MRAAAANGVAALPRRSCLVNFETVHNSGALTEMENQMKRWFLMLVMAVGMTAQAMAAVAAAPTDKVETKEQRDARMGWWREAKFGMFIHWGLYAVPAGTYDGKQIGRNGEWIMNFAKIPVARYAGYAKEFNPDKFNAEEWVRIAKNAGMKYMVITAKHHDGFAMFHSRASDFNLYDATSFKRDPLAELAEACRREGIKLGFYYSQCLDWHHRGGESGHWDKAAQDGNFDEYLDKIALPQVKELLSNYGEFPSVLWWDMPSKAMTRERAAKLYALLDSKPGIIHNNRLGGGFKGDTQTPEQFVPAGGFGDGRDWETCMTMNDTWGFKSFDNNWKSAEKLLFNLVDIVSKGGNYLLNVGPTAEGLIPSESVERLARIGDWMKVNGEAIYGAGKTCFGGEYGQAAMAKDGYGKERPSNAVRDWRCTTKAGKIYISLFKWPSGSFELPAVKGKVVKATLLAAPLEKVEVRQEASRVTLVLPAKAPDPIASVVRLDVEDRSVK